MSPPEKAHGSPTNKTPEDSRRHGHGKEIGNLIRLYADDNDRYSGSATDDFAYKFGIFSDYCMRCDIHNGHVMARFGIGKTPSLGSINVHLPISTQPVTFHVVQADTPFLLCLQDLDELGLHYNNQTNRVYDNHGKSPGRFKFTIKNDQDCRFNHTVIVDVMYIQGNPVLHVVDEATRFQAARWLPSISAEATWEALRMCWLDVYAGPPDILVHDAGTNFTSRSFTSAAHSCDIRTKCVPVESPNSIGIVERYHAPLRRAYEIIAAEMPRNYNRTLLLQSAVKVVNDTAGPDGLVPSLLVFGMVPRLDTRDPPAPTLAQRGAAVRKAMVEVAKLHAERAVANALHERNGPDLTRLHDLALGSEVLV